MPDPVKLSNPPKFGTHGEPSPAPRTLADWVSFWRWLTSLWSVAQESISAPGAVAIQPRQQPGIGVDQILGLARVVIPENPRPPTPQAIPSVPAPGSGVAVNELQGLLSIALSRQFQGRGSSTSDTSAVLLGTHSARLATPASGYPDGTLWFETDRDVFYIVSASVWVFATGVMVDVIANQPSDLGTDDANFLFIASDTNEEYYWDGAAWVKLLPSDTIVTALRGVSGNIVVLATDFLLYEFGGGNPIASLPLAASVTGQIFCFKTASGSVLQIQPAGVDDIDGAANYYIGNLQSVWVQSLGGTSWSVIASYRTPEAVRGASTSFGVTGADFLLYEFGGGATAGTLPLAGDNTGKIFVFRTSSGVGTLTVTPAGGDDIDGAASYVMGPSSAVWLQSLGGTNWTVTAAFRGPLVLPLRGVSGNTAIGLQDFLIYEFGGGASTITLPSAASCAGELFAVKASSGTGTVTITAAGGDFIEGAATYSIVASNGVIIQSLGGNDWAVISDYIPPTGAGVTSLTNGGGISLSAPTGAVTISASDSAWPAWTPTVTALGVVTTTVLDAALLVTGKTAKFRIYWEGTLGTASTFISFTLPVTPKAVSSPGYQTCSAAYFNAGTGTFVLAGVLNTGTVQTRGATLPTVNTLEVALEGTFEIN